MVFFKVPSVSGLSSDSTCKVGLKDESAKEGLNQEAAEGCALPEQESETRLRKLGNPGKRIPITLVQGKGMLWVIRKRAPKRCARGPGSNIPGWAKETKVVGGTFLEKKKKEDHLSMLMPLQKIPWPPDAKSQLIGIDPDAGEDWRQRRRGQKRTSCLDGITDSTDMNLSKL